MAIGHSSADTVNCEGLCDAEMVRHPTQVTLKILLTISKQKQCIVFTINCINTAVFQGHGCIFVG